MRNPLSDKVMDIKPSGIRKFFDLVQEMPDAISLGVGEPDFDTPWHIREEGIFSLERGRTFYTSNAGLLELRKAISAYLKRKQRLYYDPLHEVLVTVGGSEGIDLALRAMLNPGDEVILPEPCYVSYLPCIKLADGVPVTINLKEENEFKLTPEELLGAIMTRSDLEPLVKIIKEKDIFVISDEIYAELTYQMDHCSIASFPGMRERTIVINGFSKSFAMTGWRLGFAVGPENILKQMTKIHQFAIMAAPTTSQYAAIEAMENGDDDVELMRKSYNQRRRFLLNQFQEMGLQCFEPRGAFYMFPCIKEFGMTSEEFANRFLQEEKVAVVPGTAFGDCGEGFLRVSYAYSIEELKVALERMKRFIERLRQQRRD